MTLGVFFRLKLSLPRWMGRLNHLKPNVYGCWRSVEPGGMITFLYYNEELWIWSPRRHCPFKIFWVRSAYDSISLRLLKTDGWNLRITSVKGNISYKHPFLLGFLSSFLCVYHIYIYIYNFTNYNKKKNSNADKKYIYNIYNIHRQIMTWQSDPLTSPLLSISPPGKYVEPEVWWTGIPQLGKSAGLRSKWWSFMNWAAANYQINGWFGRRYWSGDGKLQ